MPPSRSNTIMHTNPQIRVTPPTPTSAPTPYSVTVAPPSAATPGVNLSPDVRRPRRRATAMLASASWHANVSRVGRRATAPSSTLPALPEDHELRESSLLRVVQTDTASPTATSIRSSRDMPKFTFTSDALPIDVPHHLIPSAVTNKNFELKEDFESDAFGNGHLPSHPIFSHLPPCVGWYHIWNAPAWAGGNGEVDVQTGGKLQEEGTTDISPIAKLKAVLGLGAKRRDVPATVGVEVDQKSEGNKRSGNNEEDLKTEIGMQGLGVAIDPDLGRDVEGHGNSDDDSSSETGRWESWKKRDARRYGLVGSFEFEGGRSNRSSWGSTSS